MSPGEAYEIKRKNFLEKTKLHFEFLVTEIGFDRPNHKFYQQENGTVTRDEFQYNGLNKNIIILNIYHPVDYGFEIKIANKLSGKTEMIHYVLKEKQDIEQSYLQNSAKILKDQLKK